MLSVTVLGAGETLMNRANKTSALKEQSRQKIKIE